MLFRSVELMSKYTRNLLKSFIVPNLLAPFTQLITKVGIFTKSPLVTRDLDVIEKLPNPSIHLNISPFDEDVRSALEPGAVSNLERIQEVLVKHVEEIKRKNIKLVLNVCPCMPDISIGTIDSALFHQAYEAADEICIGLTCLYGNIPNLLTDALKKVGKKNVVAKMSTDWDVKFLADCRKIFTKYVNKKLVIWRDTSRRGWKNMKDMSLLPQEYYAS